MAKEKAVLAYSGGLDTSVILQWMVEKGFDVTTYTADLGQGDADLEEIREKAMRTGASNAVIEDLKKEFVTDFVFPAIRGNAKYEGRYLLGTSLARPLTAKKQVELAKKIEARILSHGSTGKGNDQLRFEQAYLTLFPECEIYAPWKEQEFLSRFSARGRDAMIEYAQQHGIPISQSKKQPWSSDENLMHRSYEAGILENPMTRPDEIMFYMTVSPEEAPDKETILEIEFEKGNPVLVKNLDDGTVISDPLELFIYMNKIAGQNGIGRVDMVEDRVVGMKSRGVYETPGGTVFHIAHRDLEGLTMDREVMLLKDILAPIFSTKIYSGFWFSPEMDFLRNAVDFTQEDVTGTSRISLYKGNAEPIGRSSSLSLYDEGIASMHEEGAYDPRKARGFIDIISMRLQAYARRQQRKLEL